MHGAVLLGGAPVGGRPTFSAPLDGRSEQRVNSATLQQLLRATLFHTPRNPFVAQGALEAYADGGLLIANGRVVACGDYATLRKPPPYAPVRDLPGGFILPCLVDTHIHYPQIGMMGSLRLGLLDWPKKYALPE